ncbi:MAG: HEAT repeat domain-containing protein [Fibrobacter sp.]|nr:HEAT repeat domain-containing protein [Fibrobacter sp.]
MNRFKGMMMKRFGRIFVLLIFITTVLLINTVTAATRWSALHWVPDADLLDNNAIVADVNTFIFTDSIDGTVLKPGLLLSYSVARWVNIDIGYAGDVTFGLKTRILGEETQSWVPSLAVGIRGCFSSREMYYYDNDDDKFTNELYCAFAKSIEPIRLRLHFGVLSIPSYQREAFNPFIAFEKYFGGGVYATIEMNRRDKDFIPSVFASWRFWNSRFEISAGAVALTKMFLDKESKFDAGIVSTPAEGLARPGIYVGVRFNGTFTNIGNIGGLEPLETKVRKHEREIERLRYDVDSLNDAHNKDKMRIRILDSTVAVLVDSTLRSKDHYHRIVMDKLNSLRVFYSQEPFEPELVKKGYSEITGYRNEIVPALLAISLNIGVDKKIRKLAVSVLGRIGTGKALDALIDILSQAKEADIRIETIIGLGDNKETRALYLMKKLANDPDDALAFTAREVSKKLEVHTGSTAPEKTASKKESQQYVPETKIGTNSTSVKPGTAKDDTANKVVRPEIPSDSIIWEPLEPAVVQ